jgi:hypothetical protein
MIMNCSFLVKNNRLFTVLRKNGFSKHYGFIETDLKNIPIIKKHYIQPFYQKSSHGKFLLNYTEKILFKEYNKINLDMWCIDKYYEKNLNYYINNGYIKHKYFDKNNTVSKIDKYNNIYYQILLHKNKNIVDV